MSTLTQKLTAPENRPRVLAACEELVESEVSEKSGVTGMALKGAYRMVKAVKPGIIREVLDAMLPEFADALEPLHSDSLEFARTSGRPAPEAFELQLRENDEQAADALLSVTDRKAQGAKNRTLKKTYDKLRGSARQHVAAAVPGLARTLAPFV